MNTPRGNMPHAHDSSSREAGADEITRGRRALCEIGKLCYSRNLIVGADGNLSMRLSDDTILITPAGAMKGFLEPHHITRVDMAGRVLDNGPRASTETGIHTTAYEVRPDIRAVVHAHPPHAVALTLADIDLQMPIIPEVVVTIGGIPTAPYATPGTHELGDSIRDLLRCSDTVMMRSHGSITVGDNLMDAFKKLDMLEHTARILYLTHTLRGGLDPLPPEAVEKLLHTRKILGVTGMNTLVNRCGLDG
jgi:L-fuculose-phosphate aldolase